jgi:uncharacterized membrane protein YphA (DoxX/SURF4 family)
MNSDPKFNHAWWTLRVALGLAPIFSGLDKFSNMLTNWEMYLAPGVPSLLHVSATTFMHVVGVIEIIVGVLVLTRLTRYASYILAAWLLAIAANLLSQGLFFDIAVRDILLAVAAFVLAKLTEVRELALAGQASGATAGVQSETARRLA